MRWATSAQRAAPLAALTTGLAAKPAMFRADARHGGGCRGAARGEMDNPHRCGFGAVASCSTADWPIEDAWPALAPAGSA